MSGLDFAKISIQWSVGVSLPRRSNYVQSLCIQPDEAGRGLSQSFNGAVYGILSEEHSARLGAALHKNHASNFFVSKKRPSQTILSSSINDARS